MGDCLPDASQRALALALLLLRELLLLVLVLDLAQHEVGDVLAIDTELHRFSVVVLGLLEERRLLLGRPYVEALLLPVRSLLVKLPRVL